MHRIPFQLTDADAGVDVILLTPFAKIVDFRLQTPNSLVIEPWRALAEPGMRYVLSNGVSYYRLVLPAELVANRFDQGGTWHALLTIGHPRLEHTPGREDGVDRSILRGMSDARPKNRPRYAVAWKPSIGNCSPRPHPPWPRRPAPPWASAARCLTA